MNCTQNPSSISGVMTQKVRLTRKSVVRWVMNRRSKMMAPSMANATEAKSSPMRPKIWMGRVLYWSRNFTVIRSSTTLKVREMPYFDVPNWRA